MKKDDIICLHVCHEKPLTLNDGLSSPSIVEVNKLKFDLRNMSQLIYLYRKIHLSLAV